MQRKFFLKTYIRIIHKLLFETRINKCLKLHNLNETVFLRWIDLRLYITWKVMDKEPKFYICKFCGRRGFGKLFKKIHTVRSCLNMMEQRFYALIKYMEEKSNL